MDRGFDCRFRDYRKLLAAVSAIGLSLAFYDHAFSQERPRFQMPTPQEMFRQNDRNGNGRLDPEEINSNPFLPRMLQRSGLDTSRSITERDFIGTMEEARRNWEQSGGRGRGGDEGDRRDGRREEWRREGNEEERPGRGDGEPEEGEDPSDEETDAEGRRDRRRSAERKPRPRVTLDLQEDLVEGDRDGDGQIAFFEWRGWEGKSLSEFQQLDVNGDGYVTPREVEAIRGPAEGEDDTQIASADGRGSSDRDEDSEPDADRDAAARDSSNGDSQNDRDEDDESGERRAFRRDDRDGREAEDRDQNDERERGSDDNADEAREAAERYFRLLDRDRDGEIASDEWQGGRIRGMFEDDGIDLEESMSEDAFIDNYVRLSADGG